MRVRGKSRRYFFRTLTFNVFRMIALGNSILIRDLSNAPAEMI